METGTIYRKDSKTNLFNMQFKGKISPEEGFLWGTLFQRKWGSESFEGKFHKQ